MAENPTREWSLIAWVARGPDGQARDAILDIHTRKWAAPPAEPLRAELAQACVGYCGADLKALCTEAMLRALRRSLPEIYSTDEKLQVSAPANGSSHTSSFHPIRNRVDLDITRRLVQWQNPPAGRAWWWSSPASAGAASPPRVPVRATLN